jgi:hypothetical protein
VKIARQKKLLDEWIVAGCSVEEERRPHHDRGAAHKALDGFEEDYGLEELFDGLRK